MALDPVIAQAIFQQQAPDLVGSFEKGREMKRSAAARDKAALSEQMQGQLLAGQFSSGSQIAELAGVDPRAAAMFAKELGIPLNQPDRLKQFGLSLQAANANTVEGNPRKTIEQLVALKAQLNMKGQPTPNLDELLAGMQADPDTALGQLNSVVVGMENSNIIPQSIASKVAAEREQITFQADADIRKANAIATAKEKRDAAALAKKEADKAQIDALKAEGKDKEAEQKQVNTLRDDIDKNSKSFRQVEEAFNRINKVGKKGTAASDLSLVFNFMKMLDPGSTVREGEFANAKNAAGVPDIVLNTYERIRSGVLLTPEQRDDFIGQARDLFGAQQEATDNAIGKTLDQGTEDGIQSSRIIGTKELEAFDERRSLRGLDASVTRSQGAATQVKRITAVNEAGDTVEWNGTEWIEVQ